MSLPDALVIRLLLFVASWTSVWWTIVGAFLAPLIPGGWRTIAAAFVCSLVPLLFLRTAIKGGYPSTATRLLVFRPFWYVQLGLPLVALAALAGSLLGAPFSAAIVVGRWAAVGAAATFATIAGVGYWGSRQLTVRRLEARFPDLPPALNGMHVAQITDLHVGPHTPRRHLQHIVRAIEEAQPDLIAITGDHVDDYAGDVAHFGAAFGSLRARHGLFAIAGNHDIFAGWSHVQAGLEALGMTVLVNEAIEIVRGDTRFWVAGTGDPAARGWPGGSVDHVAPDIARALAVIPDGAFVIALAHNPALWPALARRGVHLTLSGHTHHGQVSIPRLNWSLASIFLDLAMGLHWHGNSMLYISPGTNYWGLPLRLGALPEVTIITLRLAKRRESE